MIYPHIEQSLKRKDLIVFYIECQWLHCTPNNRRSYGEVELEILEYEGYLLQMMVPEYFRSIDRLPLRSKFLATD